MLLKLWEQDGLLPTTKELFQAVKQNDKQKRKAAEATKRKEQEVANVVAVGMLMD
ncbi:hypothetical protein BT69DRAFT_1275565 [Atractiella rhizophila]|nr:hypothetical protein BT69DRAFT_1275565 [Atractiella rhizophila]